MVSAIEVRGNTRTHTRVIHRELLFEIGDAAAPEALAETERNLRRLLYLGRATVRTEAAAAGSVRVVVEVEDLYSRALSPLIAGNLDEVSFGLVALDYNLFGRGQTARLRLYQDAVSGSRATAFYSDPRVHGTRLQLSTEGSWATEGHSAAVSLGQPFYALAAPWALGGRVSSQATRWRLYSSGQLTARYDERVDAGSFWLVRSYGRRVKVRPGVRLTVSDRHFSADAPFGYAPDDRRRVVPSLSLTIWRPRYVTDRFVRYLGPQEDLQVGSWLAARIGVSSQALGADRDYPFVSLTLAPRHRSASGWYSLGSLSISSRWRDHSYWHLITSSRLVVYRRLSTWPLTPTLAARFGFDSLARPEDANSQFLLGIDQGLRGYPPRRYDGSRRLLAGLELRPVLLQRPQWALGGAVFGDLGSAWTPGRAPLRLRPSLGAGVRLGLPRIYDTPVLRADLARGVRGGVWQLSFGIGQYL